VIKVIIAAAGKGTRSKLNYPKTLFKVNGVPILIRLLKATKHIDNAPIIIASEEGRKPIGDVLEGFGFSSTILIQKNQLGMGDAVLQSRKYRKIKEIENSLLLWGDLPFIKKRTINKLLELHIKDNSDFSFPTLVSQDPYTLVKRNKDQRVVDLIELKNSSREKPVEGERDIGVFLYKTKLILSLLRKKRQDRKSELGFLNLVRILSKNGSNVNGYKIATKREALSFNSKDDLLNF